jgi:hypothetical protein
MESAPTFIRISGATTDFARQKVMIEDAIERTFDGLASELREVEESIAILIASDAFIEDLISSHARRHFLLAAIADQRAICREKFARLDAPRKTSAIDTNTAGPGEQINARRSGLLH